jgi:hypothetical protein
MNKNFIAAIVMMCMCTFANAQRISRVTIMNSGTLNGFSVLTSPDNVTVNLSPEGDIVEFGTEYQSERIQDYTRIEKYLGRVEYYTNMDDAAFRGKVKYIGGTQIMYYASYEADSLKGKVKSIGIVQLDYYRPYDDAIVRGKIKSFGSNAVTYYTSFDNEALRGKLKSLGSVQLTYYSSFDDKAFKGKIKSIGNVSYTYYSSFDRNYAGSFKTGTQNVYANGINFYIKY